MFTESAVAGNGYQFTCPVVERNALYIACIFMLNKHMRGDTIPHADCRCAMGGSKCPAAHMRKMEWDAQDRIWFDDQPTMHRLPGKVIDRIANVMLLPCQAAQALNAEQSERLFGEKSSLRVMAMSVANEESATKVRRTRSAKSMDLPEISERADLADTLAHAADLTGALNQALKTSV